MSGWAIPAAVLLALFLLGQIKVGVRGEYHSEGLRAEARVGPVRLALYPVKKKKRSRKPAPKRAKRPKTAPSASVRVGGAVKPLMKLLPLAIEAGGQFRKKLCVDVLRLEVTAGAADPADAAMIYGRTQAALGAVWGPLNQAFHIRDGRAGVRIDFDSEKTTVYGAVALSLKLWQLLWLGVYFGIRAVNELMKLRKGRKNTERRSATDGK